MADQTATPGSHFNGPIRIENFDPAQAAFTAIPASVTLAAVTGVDGTGSNAASKADVDTRLTAIQDALNAILERIQ
jgi:hypothetical protein